MTIRMISKVSHVYGGKRLKKGDPFEVPGESLARVFVAVKAAEIASPEPDPEPVFQTRAIDAEDETPRKTRSYRRRDMVAEANPALEPGSDAE